MSWPLRSVLGEAWRARRRLTLWAGLPFILLLAGLVAAEATAGIQLWKAEQRRQAAGGDILTILHDPPLTSAAACLRLARWPSIMHVGAVGLPEDQGRTGFASHPNAEAQVQVVTPGALPILGGGSPGNATGTVLGRQLADELGADRGDKLVRLGDGLPTSVTAILNTSVRFPDRGRALFEVRTQPRRTQQCLVETIPHARDTVRQALAATGIATGTGAEVRPIATGDLQDARAAYNTRASQHGWMAVAGLTALSALAAAWFARATSGLYRALGASRTDLVLVALFQTALFIIPAMTIAAAGSWLWIARTTAVEAPVQLWLVLVRASSLAALSTLVAVPLAVISVASQSLARLIRTRL